MTFLMLYFIVLAVLYAVGPQYYHSQYLVRVQAYDMATMLPVVVHDVAEQEHFNMLDRAASYVHKVCSFFKDEFISLY